MNSVGKRLANVAARRIWQVLVSGGVFAVVVGYLLTTDTPPPPAPDVGGCLAIVPVVDDRGRETYLHRVLLRNSGSGTVNAVDATVSFRKTRDDDVAFAKSSRTTRPDRLEEQLETSLDDMKYNIRAAQLAANTEVASHIVADQILDAELEIIAIDLQSSIDLLPCH